MSDHAQHSLDDAALERIVDRLVLCSIENDGDAYLYLAREIGKCPWCWRLIAIGTAARTARLIEDRHDGDPEQAAEAFTREAVQRLPEPR